jgi:membrane associated rhomboid family serine protease
MSLKPSTQLQLRGRLTRGAAWLVGIVAVGFLVLLFGGAKTGAAFREWFFLTPYSLFHEGQVWKLATSAVLYPPSDVFGFLIDGLMLFMFVPVLERWWGTKRFVTFVIASSIVGNLAAAAVGAAIGHPEVLIFGLTPFIYGSIVAFGVLFSEQPVQLFGVMPIKGRSLALGAAALMALMVLLDKQWVRGAGAFAAMGLAYAMTTGSFTPNLWWLKWKRWRVRKKLGVVDGGLGGLGGKKKPDKQKWVN